MASADHGCGEDMTKTKAMTKTAIMTEINWDKTDLINTKIVEITLDQHANVDVASIYKL